MPNAPRFVSYDLHRTGEVDHLARLAGAAVDFRFVQGDSLTVDIEQTDMLFIDTKHTAPQLYAELTRHANQVRRWIVMHDTQIYGEDGEGGGPGLLPALRQFMKERPRWSVMEHHTNNHGLTVITCDPRDKKKLPGAIKLAGNFAAAVAAHVADGLTTVEPEQLAARLEICVTCDQRNGDDCGACGCVLATKATWRTAECPLGKWGP